MTSRLSGAASIGIDAYKSGDIEGRRQVIDDGIEHGLYAFVFQGSATKHRHQAPAIVASTQRSD